jgi:formate-dependent phosphoribosylglycinamide formyltransferase (GAR transformylase)
MLKIALSAKRRELLARTNADFTKAIFAVAVASQFFKQFAIWMRAAIGLAILLGVAIAMKIEPEGKSHD